VPGRHGDRSEAVARADAARQDPGIGDLGVVLVERLSVDVHDIPEDQDQEIAGIKLQSLDAGLDVLTPDQIAYQDDYAAGT